MRFAVALEVVVLFIMILGTVVSLLFVSLVAQRLIVAAAAEDARRRRARLTPLVYHALTDASAVPTLEHAVRRGDRPVLREMLLRFALDLRGEEADTTVRLYEQLGFVDTHLAGLRARRAGHRARAAANLGTVKLRRALPALRGVLGDPEAQVRIAAVRAVGAIGGPEALTALLGLLEDPNPAVARAVQEVLGDEGHQIGAELLSYVRSTTTSVQGRRAAVDVVGWLRLTEAVETLLPLLQDPDAELRIRAVKAAAAIGDPQFLEPFHALLQDARWEVRCQAAKGLGTLGSPTSAPRLRVLLDDSQWWVRFWAAVALAEIGPAGTAALRAALADPEPRVRDMARSLLERGSLVSAVP